MSHHVLMMENLNIEKCMSKDEIMKKTKEYQTFVLKDIFSEYEPKKYINSIKKIVQKNVIP